MEQIKTLQDLIDEVLEITYGHYGAQYRKHLIEIDTERYYILKASGKLYDHIAEKDREGEREEQNHR
ncbi:MAG: hypothetical protein J1E85_01945 [Ruminococcus sp.]|nr:hypothetical protein [Ruminococcus sp.]